LFFRPWKSAFKDVRELKRLLAQDERPIARNLARQLTVFATGAQVPWPRVASATQPASRVEQLRWRVPPATAASS